MHSEILEAIWLKIGNVIDTAELNIFMQPM